MSKIIILSVLAILIVSSGVMVFAQLEPYHKVRHYGFSTQDRSDTLDFTFYNNIINGTFVYDGQIINFSSPVIFHENNFVLKDIKNRLMIIGDDLTTQSNVKVKLFGEKITEFKMYMPKEPTIVNVPLIPTYKLFPEIIKENQKETNNILENYYKHKTQINQPIANYSNVIINTEKINGITLELERNMYSASMNRIYEFYIKVENVTNNNSIPNANVTVVFNRDGHDMITQNYVSDDNGSVKVKVATIHPVFYPDQCVNVNMYAKFEEYEATQENDFVILGWANFAYLDSLDMSWIHESFWSHLPEEFKLPERETTEYDLKCNNT